MDGTLLDLLEKRSEELGSQTLYSFLDRHLSVRSTLSYAQLHQHSRSFAGVLQHEECDGQPVLIYCPHGPEFLLGFFACILAGAWPVPVTRHRAQSAASLALLLRDSGATTVVTTASRCKYLPQSLIQSRLRVLLIDDPVDQDRPYRRPVLSAEDTAFIQYTSGSTSSPKGVVISHANVLHNAETIRRGLGCTPDDIGVSWLPFHHDMGLIGHFLNPVDFVARPSRWLQAIARVGGTLSGGPDFAFALATQKTSERHLHGLTLDTWRLAYCGAEKIRPETMAKFVQRFWPCGFRATSLFPCYGLAEATLLVSGHRGINTRTVTETGTTRPAVCLGRPAHETTVLIADPASGHVLADGEIGEVCVASASVARCYYRNSPASDKVFDSVVVDGKRFCRTGDRGFMYNQHLYLLGRYKNVIKRYGRSFHAEDLEASIKEDLGTQFIGHCAAFSTDDRDGDRLVVLLERSRSRKTAADATDRHLIVRARALVSNEFGLLVDDVRVLPAGSLPLTSSGKIRRGACPDVYQLQDSEEMEAPNAAQL